jgi:hypothetical protein
MANFGLSNSFNSISPDVIENSQTETVVDQPLRKGYMILSFGDISILHDGSEMKSEWLRRNASEEKE